MFLKIKEVNYEEFFIKFDEIKLIKLLHIDSEGGIKNKWWKLKVYLKNPANIEEEGDSIERYILHEDQFDIIKEQINIYNNYCEKNNLKPLK